MNIALLKKLNLYNRLSIIMSGPEASVANFTKHLRN